MVEAGLVNTLIDNEDVRRAQFLKRRRHVRMALSGVVASGFIAGVMGFKYGTSREHESNSRDIRQAAADVRCLALVQTLPPGNLTVSVDRLTTSQQADCDATSLVKKGVRDVADAISNDNSFAPRGVKIGGTFSETVTLQGPDLLNKEKGELIQASESSGEGAPVRDSLLSFAGIIIGETVLLNAKPIYHVFKESLQALAG